MIRTFKTISKFIMEFHGIRKKTIFFSMGQKIIKKRGREPTSVRRFSLLTVFRMSEDLQYI